MRLLKLNALKIFGITQNAKQWKDGNDGCCLIQPLCTPLLILFLFQFWSALSLSLFADLFCSLCPALHPYTVTLFWQGAKEGVAAQGFYRSGLQHSRWGRWRRHLCLLHPGRRAGWPEWRAEEGRSDSLGQYLNHRLSVYSHQQLWQIWDIAGRFSANSRCQNNDDRIKVAWCLESKQTSASLTCPWPKQ